MAFQAERGRLLSTDDEPVRLQMKPAGAKPAVVSGGWWPRSRDTLAELPELVEALQAELGTVSLVALDAGDWLPGPHRIGVGDQVVAVSRSDRRPAHTILLVGRDRRQATLLVVPPDMPGPAADAALSLAADGFDTSSPTQIFARSRLASVPPLAAS